MRKTTLICIGILIVSCLLFSWAQGKIIEARSGIRIEEKILMLSDRPEVTKVAALGFDSALADLLWVRAIQYFGGNFSTLDKPEKREGLINLFDNMLALDPHFVAAYKFTGFVVNESVKDSNLAIDYLLKGADNNPGEWSLPFDAGFIAFYQLKEYELAKELFIQSIFGLSLTHDASIQTTGLKPGFSEEAIIDGDSYSNAEFTCENSSLTIDLGAKKTIGRIWFEHKAPAKQTYRLSLSTADTPTDFEDIETTAVLGVYFHDFEPPTEARFVRLDQFQTEADEDVFAVSEVKVFGARNPKTPGYVERMAYEMDRAGGPVPRRLGTIRAVLQ